MSLPSSDVYIANGITLRTLGDPPIRVYKVQTLDSRSIDIWLAHVIAGLAECSSSESYRVIYDLTDISLFALKALWSYTIGSLGMTADGEARVQALLKEGAGRSAKLAIFTHPTLSARVMKTINRCEVDVPFKIFFVIEQAVRWLEQEDRVHG